MCPAAPSNLLSGALFTSSHPEVCNPNVTVYHRGAPEVTASLVHPQSNLSSANTSEASFHLPDEVRCSVPSHGHSSPAVYFLVLPTSQTASEFSLWSTCGSWFSMFSGLLGFCVAFCELPHCVDSYFLYLLEFLPIISSNIVFIFFDPT